MHRQSIGSPNSKLQTSGGLAAAGAAEKEDKRKNGAGVAVTAAAAAATEEEPKIKAEKLVRSTSSPDKSIHIIPVLTFLCILLLYLLSHDVSPKDLETIGRAALPYDHSAASSEKYATAAGGAVGSVVRGHRGLKAAKMLRHRKLGSP